MTNFFSLRNSRMASGLLFAALLAFVSVDAFAGTGSGTFDSVYATLTEWTEGTLGRIITLSMIVVGVVAGIGRQSLLAFATGLGAGVGMYNAPAIVDTILQATIPASASITPALMTLSNGL